MGAHMKTTIELPDSLLEAVREMARREKSTLKALMERALHRLLEESGQEPAFKLRRVSFRGEGLQPGLESASWERIRELSYEGRGT